MTSSIVSPFLSVVKNYQKNLTYLAEKGQPMIGYFCNYTPIEIIDACGYVPIRISGGIGSVEKSSSLLPDFICPFMKRSVEKILNGEYAYLSGLVQGYSCDAACGVTNILKNRFSDKVFHSIPLPYNDNSSSRGYFKSALFSLIEKLESKNGTFSEENLKLSIQIRLSIKRLLTELYNKRTSRNLPLSSSDLWVITQAGYLLPPGDYQILLSSLIDELKELDPILNDGIPILVTGSLIETAKIFECIENSGATLVADDLCSGQRGFSSPPSEDSDPFEYIINNHFQRVPCASRARAEGRLEHLSKVLTQSDAQGVIFILQKFCTPHLSDYPHLSNELKTMGIPCLLVEMDEHWKTEGQFQTRLDGFLEMIG